MYIAEYIWLGGNNELRSKTRVLYDTNYSFELNNISALPKWNYDGSSTNQATGKNSEIIIEPKYVCKCPFRRGSFSSCNNILVLCDTYTPNGEPLSNNNRVNANKIFNKNLQEEPWFGIEQEFFLIDRKTKKPLGFPKYGNPNQQGQYYCSIGASNSFGREIMEKHLECCIYSGIKISGINAEVAPGQWEYQVGPCIGIDSADQLWISRYILIRIAELSNIDVEFHPKPLIGNWNGSGCHTNYSTKSTRNGIDDCKTGLDVINEHMIKLKDKHQEHMKVYGSGNELRMTGKHETASYDKFNYDIADRGRSIRIGNETFKNKCGYYEDRRPSSNMDPYLVISKLFETTVL